MVLLLNGRGGVAFWWSVEKRGVLVAQLRFMMDMIVDMFVGVVLLV